MNAFKNAIYRVVIQEPNMEHSVLKLVHGELS